MKIPEKAPSSDELIIPSKATIANLYSLSGVLKKANKEYLYWDKFKYLKFPEGITPKEAWAALKMSRGLSDRKYIGLQDKSGTPFSYWLPDSAQEFLHYITQMASRQMLVDELKVHSEEKRRYIMRSIVDEAIASSQIEGAVTTRAVAKEMIRTGRKPKDHAEKMIYNNYVTINQIKEFTDKPLTPELVEELHGHMTRDTLEDPSWEGNFRQEEVEVFDIDGQTVLHVPPQSSEIKKSIERLCDFVNEEEGEEFVHPVVKGILIHFWLAYLHPFMDGNGRTARALFYWYMLKEKYWLFEYLSISGIILKKRVQYYRAFLYSEIDDGDATYFIMFHLRAIRDAIDELRDYLERKLRESKNARRFLTKYPQLNHRQRALLASALENPEEVYTFEVHKRVHDVAYQTARADMLGLHELGLLDMRKMRRKFYFTPVKDLREKLQ
jgi:Fic family protein